MQKIDREQLDDVNDLEEICLATIYGNRIVEKDAHTTAFDILLHRVFAGEKLIRRDITRLGYGGQCIRCEICRFPDCYFEKC